ALKNITDQEQFDNKFYQENDNIYENDFNYTVKTANYRFSQQANILSCQSQIRTKLLERNYDGISANYYKKIESIQNKINNYKITLETAEKLNQIIQEYIIAKYNAKLHLEETNNLLEIEKNKLLKEFNMSMYEHNISNISLAKEYGFKKIDLENQKAEENMKLRIELEKAILEKNSVSTDFSIKREELNEQFSKIKTQIINNNDLKTSKESYMSALMENDIHYIGQLFITYSSFLNSYKRTYFDLVKIILEDISPNEENFHYLESFLNKFLELFLHFSKEMLNNFTEIILQVLDKKMKYIYAFKYQSSLDSIEERHSQDITLLKEKKNEILDKMDSSSKTIENFRQKIFTLINDSEMIIHTNQPKKKKADATSQSLMRQTDLKIRDYKEKIDNFIKMNKMYEDDIAELNQKLATTNNEYKTELTRIEKMIRVDMHIYLVMQKQMADIQQRFNEKIAIFEASHMLQTETPKKFLSQVDATLKKVSEIADSAKREYGNVYDHFVKETKKDIAKREMVCSMEFKNDVKEFNQKYNKMILDYHAEYTKAIQSHEAIINEQSAFLEQMMDMYNHKLDIASKNFQEDSMNLDRHHTDIRNDFFSSYHALDDNHQNIIQYHLLSSSNKEAKFTLDKDTLEKKKAEQINASNVKLKKFIQTKNEEIEHLPIAFKFNSKILNKETKKKNLHLHEDIKTAKTEYNLQNKLIEKNIKNLRNQLSQDKFDNEFDQKRNILKEKKNNI
ncbi:MAG: hypothetical protein K2N65_00905, partial [Anaeroplasmataceae bacterium]|nr:hypothetical protein [Anaeroplasmataceae bacterium]